MNQQMAGKILKGLYSGALTFCGTMATTLQDSEGLSSLHAGQWFTVGAFTIAAIGGTYGLAGWKGPSMETKP